VLPPADEEGFVEHDGARLWYSRLGHGRPVILLHGGLGHGGNFGHQVPALRAAGLQVVLMDSRGQGRSTRDARPFSYELLATDVVAVMDRLGIPRAALVGWSDGACTSLVLARTAPQRVEAVFFFACNMDPTGAKPFSPSPALERCFARHRQDFRARSATPEAFDTLVKDLGAMQTTQPNYTAAELEQITVPVTVAQSEGDEFITREHAEYLARTLPNARYVFLNGVSHFAPLQRPALFNRVLLDFLSSLPKTS
jgi:pimeloyl-ACP methyl ester carboxylesterase